MSKGSKKRADSILKMSPSPIHSGIASFILSCGVAGGITEARKGRYPLWPEWNEADVNAEKWEGIKPAKEKEKSAKSPSLQLFEDPEGKIELPPSLKVHSWKRPHEFLIEKNPVVVKREKWFDLLSANEHILESELMRWIISEITMLWDTCLSPTLNDKSLLDETGPPWRPWEHIYALCKAVKGHLPLYNSYGKYIVRLYWMGCWRKITLDDTMPFDKNGNLLLPATTCQEELWPMLLSKALIKLADIDMITTGRKELGDFTVLHALTGWRPEIIPLRSEESEKNWSFLKTMVPEFSLTNREHVSQEQAADVANLADLVENAKKENEAKVDSIVKPAEKVVKDKPETKEAGKKKNKEGEHNRDRSKSLIQRPGTLSQSVSQSVLESVLPTPVMPQMVIYATYLPLQLSEGTVSVLGQMAESSEKLRHYGLSHAHSHPVLVRRTRSCSLVNPAEVSQVPRWKLIRPRNRPFPIADPKKPKPKKPEQYIEIASPLLDYKIDTTIMPPEKNEQQKLKKGAPPSLAAVTEIDETLDQINDAEENMKSMEPPPNTENSQLDMSDSDELASIPSLLNKQQFKKHADNKRESHSESTKSVGQLSAKSHGGKSRHGSAASRFGSGKSQRDSTVEPKKESRPESIKSGGQFSSAKSRLTISVDPNKEENLNIQQQLQSEIEDRTSSVHAPDQEVSRTSSQMLNLDNTSDVAVTFDQKKFCMEKWIDYEDFFKCFQTLIIFHNPSKYAYTFDKSNFKFTDDRGPFYLLVDDVKPIEILVTFSALVRWGDLSCEKSLSKESNEKDHQKEVSGLLPGVLLAEPYSWKSFVSSPPVLYMKTLATKSTILELPSGRHVLRFTATSPLGYNINLSGTVPFTFGDEDLVVPNLDKESQRFTQQAVIIMKATEKLLSSFSDEHEFRKASMELEFSHFPVQFQDRKMADKQIEAFNDAFYVTLQHALHAPLSPEEEIAFRALLLDLLPKETLRKKKPHAVPEQWRNRIPTKEEERAVIKLQAWWRSKSIQFIFRARKVGTEENEYVQDILDQLRLLLESNTEQNGLYLLRYLFNNNPKLAKLYPFYEDELNRTVFADYTTSYSDQPPHFWFVLFREVFHMPGDMLLVPKVYTALSASVLHVINNDTGEEIPRVFQKVAPHVYTKNKSGYTFMAEAQSGSFTLPSGKWKMRLIGTNQPLPTLSSEAVNSNFTMKEIKSYYIPNDKNLIFRFQINVNATHLTTIHVQTSKPDVYIKLQVLDQEKEVAEATGKGQVVIPSFMFYQSLGHSAFQRSSIKQPDTLAVQGGSKKSASNSSKTGKGSLRSGSDRRSSPLKDESSFNLTTFIEEIPVAAEVTHKYIVQALVLHKSWPLNESDLTFAETQKDMDYSEITEKNIGPGSSEIDEPKHTPTSRQTKKGKDKGDKSDKDKGKDKSTPLKTEIPGQQIDSTKPHFTLHYVVDYGEGDCVDIKKDTNRQDEIHAMKRAWEAAEPGRAFKALQLRLHVLNNKETNITLQSISEKQDEIVNGDGSEVNGQAAELKEIPSTVVLQDIQENQSTAVDRNSQVSDDIIKPMKWTQYVRSTLPEPVLENEKIIEEREKIKTEEIHNFRQRREIVFERRERERQTRRQLKAQHLQMYEDLQATLDEARQDIFQLRESYRNKLIEEEMKKQKEIAEMEALQAEQERKNKSAASKKSKSPGRKK
ncbi:androglobin [Pristis pectinata]|uniref:androglobin n=1 Tax=Pristis pectinata TaxID=685728 RepID=UPI00223DE901|nr:androglobin [Pristis pectinata]